MSVVSTPDAPLYRLRADTTTQFTGYAHEDFSSGIVHAPVLSPTEVTEAHALNYDQAKAVLSYLLECGVRMTHMTRTFDDVEAVTSLLREKEKVRQLLLGRKDLSISYF